MRTLGIDYGQKRVGVAVSDESVRFAFPLEVLANDKKIFGKLRKVCREKEIKEIILGLPLDFGGRPTHATQGAKNFKIKLEKELGLPVIFENEILTTKGASRQPARAPRNPARIRQEPRDKKIDASAAALILKTYLDRKNLIE